MNHTPFENISRELGTAFSSGLTQATTNGLAAVSTPLMSVVVLWVIVQGILVMRGDVDARGGVTRIIRVALVVGLLTSTDLYSDYVMNFFQTTLPNWIAASVSSSGDISDTPQAFDQIWNTTVHEVVTVQSQVDWYDVVDQVSLALIELIVNVLLLMTFAVYEISQVMVAAVIAIGPFVLAGYLFDATKRVAENWFGKLIGLTILTLLVNIAVVAILDGEQLYVRSIVTNPASGTGAVPVEIQILFELCMFLGLSAFIIVLLPGIAAVIGGGIGFNISGIGRHLSTAFDRAGPIVPSRGTNAHAGRSS
jgi:type IV secretion system protein VirB6